MARLEEVKDSEDSEDVKGLIAKTRKAFEDAMDDDLDVSKTLATMFNLVKDVNTLIDEKKLDKSGAEQVKDLMMDFDKVLGVLGDFWKRKEEKLSEEVEELIRKREEARKAKDWKTADAIRTRLQSVGIILEDTPEGVKWKKERHA
jgi:cysteinyl-tRNA synthetase